ncbi:hypothetical protein EVC45_44290 [Paraburkholderia sp. UYCP14C]|uniref:hypothetical protein n=1 Tax=Paraburkholderia sp. UYCP14C TaxID=2511130 RepID=UPI00102046C4|nr:hypothetical protein [Paraburkholderia sp. UYCP14C]RZF23482.1 hypothetical protein EVC45_44290 [Paraburkholderia sp. UYCP14C]
MHRKLGKLRLFGAIIFAATSLILCHYSSAQSSGKLSRISISNTWSGAMIVVWAHKPGNWLWGYTPYDAKSWGDYNNWSVIYNNDSTITFKNVGQGTCMTAYSIKGLTHETCSQSANQKFQPVLSESGAIQLKSISLKNQCIHAFASSDWKYAFGVNFTTCALPGEAVDSNQLWTLNPEVKNSRVSPHEEL